jgi:hypothetical protein
MVPRAPKLAIRAFWFQSVTGERGSVTAEVAGSSPVVPAIDSKELIWHWRYLIGVQKGHQNVPKWAPFAPQFGKAELSISRLSGS